jgi:hypothetical protein
MKKSTICPFCKNKLDSGWIETRPGVKKLIYWCCLRNEQKNNSSKRRCDFSFGKYKDAVAFGFDKKTGRPVAVDQRGNYFDPNNTRYADSPNDHFGWKATGKIKPKKTYII